MQKEATDMEEKKPIKSPSAAYQIIEGEAVIIVPSEQMVNVLNPVGSRIWDLADGRKSIAQIAEFLMQEFDVSYETALKDAIEFTGDLAEKKMMDFAGKGKE
jgi:hypothetical protein